MTEVPDLKQHVVFPDFAPRDRFMDMRNYDGVEIHPVSYDPETGDCEQCDPDDPRLAMWSVYLHLIPTRTTGGIDCVADFKTEIEADRFAQGLCWANGWELPK